MTKLPKTPELLAQGDTLYEKVGRQPQRGERLAGNVVLEGEVTNHFHKVVGGATLFRDESLARDVPASLYVCHINTGDKPATVVHDEHDPLTLEANTTYRVRRQREWSASEAARFVED